MRRLSLLATAALVLASAAVGARAADDGGGLQDQASAAARGAFQLCKSDAPDAAAVAEHGEIWGWPHFVPYLETPDGYKRLAGGQSRRSLSLGDKTASVELSVQNGVVKSAAPANVRYFRCNVAADQAVNGELERYFTDLYGAPAAKGDAGEVWLGKAASTAAPDSEDAALKAVVDAGVGAEGVRVELTRERGLDRAKLTLFTNVAPE